MSFADETKKQAFEVDVEASSFSSGGIEFTKEDIEESEALFHRERKLSQGLSSRLIGMIALVGVFGTGLFLSSGGTLATAGPVGMFIAYIFVGLVIGINQIRVVCCERCGDILDRLESGDLHLDFIVVIVAVNSYNVKWYGEIEFGFGILKILLILGLIIVGLVIDLGGAPNHDRLGFRYWKTPGPFAERYTTGSLGKFLAFWKCVSSTVYSFGGAQTSAFLAGETEHPRRAINRAMKRIMIRVLALYWLAIFILSLIVPYTDKEIAAPNGNASGSAWVIAVQRSGIKVLPHIINAIVLTSALSAANLGIINASRTLYGLATNGQAPKIFLKVNRFGLPWVGVIFGCAFLPLAYMSVSETSAEVFSWFQNITSSNLLLNWMVYASVHIALNRALKAQGFSRKDLPYTVRGGQYAGPISLTFSTLFLITGGFFVFIHGYWKFASFFSAYFIIPLYIGLFIFAKIFFKTKYIKPSEVKLRPLFYDVYARPEPPFEKLKGWKWITVLWS
ncbi:Dicarboxylic amino acid permease [Candida viswanathii]|uniref:Dicarboxylic amino acid permease n=1 Tax=Candida viswanathii TaxID=5486 RepID=A0A367Y1S6_9ASCO|nr:Dicarboxylic amino acid permease [Candida viswanathii]